MSGRVIGAVAAAIVMLAVGGCAGFGTGATSTSAASSADPTATSTTSSASAIRTTDSKLAEAQRSHEYPAPPPRETTKRGAPTAVTAIEVFTIGYINWNAASLARTMRALAAISIGQARSEVSLAASQTAQDYELRRGGVANSGVVQAIAPVSGTRYQYAVVTRERTTATNNAAYQGLPPAWHLTLATVSRLRGGGWVVSGWQPEN
jgi:hypothetical protein